MKHNVIFFNFDVKIKFSMFCTKMNEDEKLLKEKKEDTSQMQE